MKEDMLDEDDGWQTIHKKKITTERGWKESDNGIEWYEVDDKRKLNKKSLMTEFEWNKIDERDNQRKKMIRTGIVIESRDWLRRKSQKENNSEVMKGG